MKTFIFENKKLQFKLYITISIVILISASLFAYSASTLSRSLIYIFISLITYFFLFSYLKEIRKSITNIVFNDKVLIVNYQDSKRTPLVLQLDEIKCVFNLDNIQISGIADSEFQIILNKEHLKNKDQWLELVACFKIG